jgi:hypothetical protein
MGMQQVSATLVNALKNGLAWVMPIAWENTDFSAINQSGEWVRVTNMPSSLAPKTLGANGLDLYEGYVQVDVFAAENTGSKALLTRADQVRAYFWAGRRLVYNGQEVAVRRAEPSPIRRPEAGGSVQISLFIYWSAWLPRT